MNVLICLNFGPQPVVLLNPNVYSWLNLRYCVCGCLPHARLVSCSWYYLFGTLKTVKKNAILLSFLSVSWTQWNLSISYSYLNYCWVKSRCGEGKWRWGQMSWRFSSEPINNGRICAVFKDHWKRLLKINFKHWFLTFISEVKLKAWRRPLWYNLYHGNWQRL